MKLVPPDALNVVYSYKLMEVIYSTLGMALCILPPLFFDRKSILADMYVLSINPIDKLLLLFCANLTSPSPLLNIIFDQHVYEINDHYIKRAWHSS